MAFLMIGFIKKRSKIYTFTRYNFRKIFLYKAILSPEYPVNFKYVKLLARLLKRTKVGFRKHAKSLLSHQLLNVFFHYKSKKPLLWVESEKSFVREKIYLEKKMSFFTEFPFSKDDLTVFDFVKFYKKPFQLKKLFQYRFWRLPTFRKRNGYFTSKYRIFLSKKNKFFSKLRYFNKLKILTFKNKVKYQRFFSNPFPKHISLKKSILRSFILMKKAKNSLKKINLHFVKKKKRTSLLISNSNIKNKKKHLTTTSYKFKSTKQKKNINVIKRKKVKIKAIKKKLKEKKRLEKLRQEQDYARRMQIVYKMLNITKKIQPVAKVKFETKRKPPNTPSIVRFTPRYQKRQRIKYLVYKYLTLSFYYSFCTKKLIKNSC